ncbi:hypothetical protein DFH09DRAFT_1284851 [Mycena vulgaris]|nr:hypothetical protein DFH09DRAFT_1284851 [Mycena vulgaris]
MSLNYDWRTPGVDYPPPAQRDGYGPNPLPIAWHRLKFGPIGLYDLRRRIAGASTDGKHIQARPDQFFPEFDTLRDSVPIGPTGGKARKKLNEQMRQLIFDLATCWDRVFGGTTMIMHIEGTTVPNTPPLPQYLRSSTYLPPSFIAENPASHAPIARITQLFIEAVGVPTVQSWRHKANRRGWSLTQNGPTPHANNSSPILIPQPAPDSAHYKFNGRPAGTIDTLVPPTLPLVVIPDSDEPEEDTLGMLDAIERAEYAEAQASEYLCRIDELEAQEAILVGRVAALEDITDDLQLRLTRSIEANAILRGHVNVNAPRSTAARPVRAQPFSTPVRSSPSASSPQRVHGAGRGPPPYSPSPSRSSTSHTLSPLVAANTDDDQPLDMDTYLTSYGMEQHISSMHLVGRMCNPAKWFISSHLHRSLMPPVYTTITAASSKRIRLGKEPPPKQAPVPALQLKQKRVDREKKQGDIDDAVGEWRDFTFAKAEELAARFDMKARYFLDIFFQGGAHMINHQQKPNPYNAYKAERAAENRELGIVQKVPELHKNIIDDYNLLTDEAKEALIERHIVLQNRNTKLRRDTPRAKIQDVSNVVRNMKMLLTALGNRVGIEGFFCLVRNNAEFHMAPEWFFTSRELENYMPMATRKTWDTGEVGMKVEAFAVAGCDASNLLRTSRQKADWIKGEIRDQMKAKLIAASHDKDAKMSYTWFEEDIVHRYNIILEGWTPSRFVNPSELSTSLVTLRALLDALKNGDCAFKSLTPEEAMERRTQWDTDVAAGKVVAKYRNVRSDLGVPRKRGREEEEEEDALGTDEIPGAADEVVPDTTVANAATATAAVSSATPPAKQRSRKAKPAAPATSVTSASGKSKKGRKKRVTTDGTPALGDITNRRSRRVVSKATISTDDEQDTDGPAPRKRTKRALPQDRGGDDAPVTRAGISSPVMNSEDEMDADPDADAPDDDPMAATA